MAITLAQAAVLSENQLQRGVIETFIQTSPVLDRIPFMEIEGNAFAYNKEATLPGVAFRDVNQGYTESTGTFNQLTETLKIMGGDADVDKFIQQTRSNLTDQRAEQTALKTKAISYTFQDYFINGDTAVDALGWDGLKKRLTGANVIVAGTNGLPVVGTSSNDRQAFFDILDQAIAGVGGATADVAIYANPSIAARLKSSARRESMYDQQVDTFGKLISTYQGVPILSLGTKADGTTQILPQTETQGTAAGTTSSIYVVRFGSSVDDGGVTGLTNGGVQVYDLGELETKPALRTRIEFYNGLAVFSGTAAVRITGVLNA